MRTFKDEALLVVKDFGYGKEVYNQVKKAETDEEITKILKKARENFDFEESEKSGKRDYLK